MQGMAMTMQAVALLAATYAPSHDLDPTMQTTPDIPGYTLGQSAVPQSPVTLADLAKIQQSLLMGPEDLAMLRRSKEILAPQVEEVLDVWYGFVGSHDFLLDTFVDRGSGKPDGAYLAAVRKRFGQWIMDTASADYGQKWLDYQIEIGMRHHRSGKNKTDGANASAIVPYRYLPALIVPITTTLRPFLAKTGASPEEVDKMHAAWVKSVTLQVILWSYPYVRDGDF